MPGKQHEELVSILDAALAEPFGIIIQTSDTVRAKMSLYRARAAANRPELAYLQIRTSPFPEGDLIICHNQKVPPIHPRTDLGTIDLQGVLDLDE